MPSVHFVLGLGASAGASAFLSAAGAGAAASGAGAACERASELQMLPWFHTRSKILAYSSQNTAPTSTDYLNPQPQTQNTTPTSTDYLNPRP